MLSLKNNSLGNFCLPQKILGQLITLKTFALLPFIRQSCQLCLPIWQVSVMRHSLMHSTSRYVVVSKLGQRKNLMSSERTLLAFCSEQEKILYCSGLNFIWIYKPFCKYNFFLARLSNIIHLVGTISLMCCKTAKTVASQNLIIILWQLEVKLMSIFTRRISI